MTSEQTDELEQFVITLYKHIADGRSTQTTDRQSKQIEALRELNTIVYHNKYNGIFT